MVAQKKKSSRTYSSGTMSALNHPMRVTLYDLIKQGAKTTPELAQILNENRINLYHHLQKLEEVGLIESYYGNNRIKKYRLKDLNQHFQHTQKLMIQEIKQSNPEPLIQAETIIAIPPKEKQNDFNRKVRELLKLANVNLDKNTVKNLDIIQVQILYQPKKFTQYLHKQIGEMKKQRK